MGLKLRTWIRARPFYGRRGVRIVGRADAVLRILD